MWKKVPDPNNPGQLVEAVPLEITDGNTDATINVTLSNGTSVSLQFHLNEISIIQGRNDPNGNPVYDVVTSGKMNIQHRKNQ